jgi:hypothetical protein
MKKRILWALAACLLLVLAAGGAQAEGEKVYTSGDYSYTLNSYGEATLLSMPAPEDAAEPLLVPSAVKGHKVIYLDASCVPVDVDEVLLPQGCFMRHYQMQTHEFRAYWYLDYERIREQELDDRIPHSYVKPGEYLLTGPAYLYSLNGEREDLVQDYYLYPTSVNGAKIWIETSPDSVTSYTSGPYTYIKMSPETAAICSFSDEETRKVNVPETLDGLTVVALTTRYGWGVAINAPLAKEITLPATLKVIGDYAIYAPEVKELVIPEGVEEIGGWSIETYSVKKMTMPSTLRKIGPRAFNGCRSLKQVTMGAGVEEIDPTAFEDTAKKFTIIAPKGSYAEAFAKKMKYGYKKGK